MAKTIGNKEPSRKKVEGYSEACYENVPIYHAKFDTEGIRPEDIRTSSRPAEGPLPPAGDSRRPSR